MKGLKGKGVLAAPGDYTHFKSQVPLHKLPVGAKQWRYYDFGPKVLPPLICLPGTAGTADVHYKQIMAMSIKGYRVISVDIPRVWNHHEWVNAFEKFLDAIDVHHVHLYGTSLGGFLAQLFAQHRPRRVKSLVLSNTFLDTRSFAAAMPWAPVVSWTPSFLLKRYVLIGIRDGPHEPFIADSVDFVVSQVEALSRDDLASRLTLTADSASVGPLLLPDKSITTMDTNDYCAISQHLKDEVGERYPGARRADLKTGGDFPFLSRPDEVNLHLQLHLRRVGVEPRPDLVQGAPSPRVANVEDHQPKGDEGSSRGPPKSVDRYDNDGPSDPLKDVPENAIVVSKTDEQEEIDLSIPEDDPCRGSLGGVGREDEDDSHDDDQGSSRGPLRKESTESSQGPPQDAGSSGSSSKNGVKDVNDAPEDSEAGFSVAPVSEGAQSSSLNPQLISIALKYITGFGQAPLMLNQELRKLTSTRTFSEFRRQVLVVYVLPIYTEALYIACSLFFCRSRLLSVKY